MRRAKILATLGPSSNTEQLIQAKLTAGVNAVRINMSHGTHEEHTSAINNARSAAQKLGVPLSVLVDLSGPKIRTRHLKDGKPVELIAGERIVITTREVEGSAQEVGTNFGQLPEAVKPDVKILLDDGALELRVEEVKGKDVVCRIIVGKKD